MTEGLSSALSHFETRNGELIIAGRPITEIVREHGTPLYLYSRSILDWRHKLLRQTLPDELKIYYAVKANPHVDIIRIVGNLYDGLDVASKGEILRSIQAGISPQVMSFAGPGKSLDELRFAVNIGIGTISVESEREVQYLHAICDEIKRDVGVLIRVNPAFDLAKSGLKMGGGPKQFGIDSERVPALIQELSQHRRVRFEGIHIFAGSQNLNADAILETFEKIMEYAAHLSESAGATIRVVNLGGGFGIPYFAADQDLDLGRVGYGLHTLLQWIKTRLPDTEFKIELGRYIVGECGLYVSEVLYRKISRKEVFLVLNGGMNHHLAASGNLGQSFVRRAFNLTIANRLDNPIEKVNIVGPLCTPMDSFGIHVELPHAEEGDLLAILNSGAYGYSTSPLGFLSHEPPKEVLI